MNLQKNNVTICASKNSIQNCYNQIWNLRKIIANAKSNLSENSEGGLEVLQEIVSQKYEIDKTLNEINEHLPTLKKFIIKKRKKRDKKRVKINETYVKNQARRNEMNMKIDQNLKEICHRLSQDKIACDLEKKKQDEIKNLNLMIKESSNQLALISSLSILRHQRKSTLSFEADNDDEKEFHIKLTEMSTMWKNHLENLYHRLNLLSNEEKVSKDEQLENDRNERLFGDPTFNENPIDRMSTDSLVSIRRKWDVFITSKDDPDGSYIPKNWVESSMSFDEFFDKM